MKYYNNENSKEEETNMAPTTTNDNRNLNPSSSSSSSTNNEFSSNNGRFGSAFHNDIGQIGALRDPSGSNGINESNPQNGDLSAYRNGKLNIQPNTGSSSVQWNFGASKPIIESVAASKLNGEFIDDAHNKTQQAMTFIPHNKLELKSDNTAVGRGLNTGMTRIESQQISPPRSNKESPPSYDQALLSHHNTISQQLSGFQNTSNNLTSDSGIIRDGGLQRLVPVASDANPNFSQNNSPSLPTKPTRLPYGIMHHSPPLPPQTTSSKLPQGDFHIASFTKPIPTSSYITSLSSDTSAVSQYRLPQASMSRDNPSPPLQPLPSMATTSTPPLMSSIVDQSNSFTNTFLRGILTSIDSKDPVVANAWLETLLDAIDLLPPDVIRREIVILAVKKGHPSQSVAARKSSCRLLGKIATKLDQQLVRQEVLPTALSLCQDIDTEVRYCMCRHLALVSCGVGLETTKTTILPQLVELCDDKQSDVRLAAIETVVQLLGLLDDETCRQIIIPLVKKTFEQAKQAEDETLVNIAHYVGRLSYGLMTNLSAEQKTWFINFYQYLSNLDLDCEQEKDSDEAKQNSTGLQNKNSGSAENNSTNDEKTSQINDSNHHLIRGTNTSASPMPDLVSMLESTTTNLKSEIYSRCRYECAYNFPAMVLFAEARHFSTLMYPIFEVLSIDKNSMVRSSIASSLHELAKIIGTNFDLIKNQIVNLFSDDSIEVLEHMVTNMVHIIDALARSGTVLQFGQGGQFSIDISNALLHCEEMVSKTRNWRLQADCLEKFSCLANCISPLIVQEKFIPLLFGRIKTTRTLPCKIAAARTLLVILRFTVKSEDRAMILHRIKEDTALAKSCHIRMLFLKLCDMSISLFSKDYFKRNFFLDVLQLASDSVVNVRLKICSMLPRLKSLLCLPSDRKLLEMLEDTVKNLLLRETDTDVLYSVKTMIEELESTEVGVDGVPSMNLEEDKDNDRKLKEERLIESMEDQLYKVRSVNSSPSKQQSPAEVKKSSIPSPLTSPSKQNSKRERDEEIKKRVSLSVASSSLANVRRRSESLPPQLKKPVEDKDETPFTKMPYNSYSSQISDPSGTYSHDLSTIKPEVRSNVELFKVPSFLNDDSKTNRSVIAGGIKRDQPYSSSLENLDPSAKEFLVDAGIILNNVSPSTSSGKVEDNPILPSATSLTNISKIDNFPPKANTNLSLSRNAAEDKMEKNCASIGTNEGIGTLDPSGNMFIANSNVDGQEGDLSKYLISNEEMKRYEAEYQKASIALKTADAMSLQSLASILNESSIQISQQKDSIDNSSSKIKLVQQNGSSNFGNVLQLPQKSISNSEKPFQNIGMANPSPTLINKAGNNLSSGIVSNVGNPNNVSANESSVNFESKNAFNHSMQYVERNLNGSQPQVQQNSDHEADKESISTTENKNPDEIINDSVMEAQNMLTNFAATFSTNKIQDSIEKFAEKIESKRKSLVAATTSSSTNVTDSIREKKMESNENSTNFEVVLKQNRASVMEKKLQAIKEQGIPKKRSLLKPPGSLTTPTKQIGYPNAHKRFSLTDQMNAAVVGKHAMQRLMQTPRKQQPTTYNQPLISSPDVSSFSSESSEDKSCESSSGNSDPDTDDPKIIHKLKQVRRLASMDETLMLSNQSPNNLPRQSNNRPEMKKRLPQPQNPSSSSRGYSHTYDDRENPNMVTYVPPLSEAEHLTSNSNDVFYSGNDSTRPNNSTLVVKPIDGRLSTAFVNGQTLQSIARPEDKHLVPSHQTMYKHSTSRALPQLPKSSVVGNGQQIQDLTAKRINKALTNNQNIPRIRNASDSALNNDANFSFKQNPNQYQAGHDSRDAQLPPAYRANQRSSIATLHPRQGENNHSQQSQISQIQQNHTDVTNVNTINSSMNIQQENRPISSKSIGTYRAPPPYPFSPPPPPHTLGNNNIESKVNLVRGSNPMSIGNLSSIESRVNVVEYRQQQVVNSPNRFTKVPPPKYRPHQPPSAQKKVNNDGIQPRSLGAVPINSTSEANIPNRSSFGGVPSYSNQPLRQVPTRNLKPNVRYGKSLSAESVLFTERMENDETEFIEIPDGQNQQYSNQANKQQVLRSQQQTPRPQSLGSQGSIAVNKPRMLPQTRTIHMRSETPLPVQHNRKSIGIPNRSVQQSQFDNENEEDTVHVKHEIPIYKPVQQSNLQAIQRASRPSQPNFNHAIEQSQSHPIPRATNTINSTAPLRRSSGIRMWQNSSGPKGASTSNLQRQIQQTRITQHGGANLTQALPRQSSHENMRRSPSPSMQHQRPQGEQQSIHLSQTKTRMTNNGHGKMILQHPGQNLGLQNHNPNEEQKTQQPNRSRASGLTQPGRKMSSSSPSSRGINSQSMLQKVSPNTRNRPNSMHSSPGSSRPSSPHLNNRQAMLQPNPQQLQKRRSYQHPPTTQMETSTKHPYGSTGSLQNMRNQNMGPSSLPMSGRVNRPQSADQSGSRFVQQGGQLFHGSRPASQQPIKVENSIPLPKRNIQQSTNDQSGTKIQRNSLSSQHMMASRKAQQQTNQIIQPASNSSSSLQSIQSQNQANQQQQRVSNNKSSAIYSNPPRINGPSSLPMPGFSSKPSMQRRK